ncbi:ankyrin [Hypoxylon cercidicola]|nr:ankyrin [Hypoxylon cercidicola]
MNLFYLPVELVDKISEFIVLSRKPDRVMRIRLVNRRFKYHIDLAIFRLRFFTGIGSLPLAIEQRHNHKAWLSYLHSYLAYQAPRERSTSSLLGRIYHIAQALCEQDGDTGDKAISTCLDDLIRVQHIEHSERLFHEPTNELQKDSESDFNADVCVAAVCLGRKAHVERLIAEGTRFHSVYSGVFGHAFEAALSQGNLDMVQLLISCTPEYSHEGTLSDSCQGQIICFASKYGHPALFNFGLDQRPFGLPEIEDEGMGETREYQAIDWYLALCHPPSPEIFERVVPLLGPFGDKLDSWLPQGVFSGNVELVRHLLRGSTKPVRLGYCKTPSLTSVISRHDETMARVLLDAGANPNSTESTQLRSTALVEAVWHGRVAFVKLLLDRGADINNGCPPPIVLAVFKEHLDMFRLLREHGARLDTPETGNLAMALAKSHGLDSMVDLLKHEGVSEDEVLHVAFDHEIWYKRLWPVPRHY